MLLHFCCCVSGSKQSSTQSSHPLPTPSMPLLKSTTETKRAQVLPIPRPESEILSSPHLKAFSYADLQNATKNFRADNLLGEGGFGYVYKGWLDKEKLTPARPGSGMVVAVKKLKPKGFQGHKEWLVSNSFVYSIISLCILISCSIYGFTFSCVDI